MDLEFTGDQLPPDVWVGCPVVVNKYLAANTILLHCKGTVSAWIETDSVESIKRMFEAANVPLKTKKRWTDATFAKACGIKLG